MTRVVLSENVTRDDVDDAAARLGWQLSNVLPADTGRPAQLIFSARGRRTFVYLVDDQSLGVAYLTASGDDADAVLAAACAELPFCAELPSELEALFRQDEPDADAVAVIARGLAIAALSAPTGIHPAGRRLALLQQALAHPDPRVRAAGIAAAGHARWPTLSAALEEMAGRDPLPAFRAAAAELGRAMEAT